jgi:hypothetical protein
MLWRVSATTCGLNPLWLRLSVLAPPVSNHQSVRCKHSADIRNSIPRCVNCQGLTELHMCFLPGCSCWPGWLWPQAAAAAVDGPGDVPRRR